MVGLINIYSGWRSRERAYVFASASELVCWRMYALVFLLLSLSPLFLVPFSILLSLAVPSETPQFTLK